MKIGTALLNSRFKSKQKTLISLRWTKTVFIGVFKEQQCDKFILTLQFTKFISEIFAVLRYYVA
jgi:hypothetical protein